MAKKLTKSRSVYQGNLLRYLYANRLTLRRVVNIMMRLSMISLFFFLIGMYQRFATATQYRLLDITRYMATFAFSTTLFMIILRILANRYRRIKMHHLVLEILYMFVMLIVVIIGSTMRVWLMGSTSTPY